MIESIGKVLVDPLAERWKNAAVGGSLACWLLLGALALFSRSSQLNPSNWPVGCDAGHRLGRSAWCTVSAADKTVLIVVGVAAAVIATAFLVQALAPYVFRLLQADGWGNWPVLPVVPRRIQSHFRRGHERKYPTAQFPGGLRPTRVGNRLAALAERVEYGFGYQIGIVWDVFVASLPPDAYDKLSGKSKSIMLACQHLLLAVSVTVAAIFLMAGGWLQFAVLLVLALITVALWRTVDGLVDEYCDLVLSTMILHHDCLYTALGETPPALDKDLRKHGLKLTEKIEYIIG